MNDRDRKAGFSFIELLVVMLIIGILSGLAYLRFGPAFQRARVRAAANLIAGDLQAAQVLAGRERIPVVLTTDTDARTYTIANRAGDRTFVNRSLADGSDYGVDTLRATVTSMQFFPNGFASGSGTWTVASGSYARSVVLTRAGQIRVTDGS